MKKVAIKKVAKKMIMRKLLSCLVIIAILVSVVPVLVVAVNDSSNNATSNTSASSNENLLEKLFIEKSFAETMMPFLTNNTADVHKLPLDKTIDNSKSNMSNYSNKWEIPLSNNNETNIQHLNLPTNTTVNNSADNISVSTNETMMTFSVSNITNVQNLTMNTTNKTMNTVVSVSVLANEPTILSTDSQDIISSLYDDFNVDTGRTLASSSTWKFWSENSDKFNVKANSAVLDGKAKVLQLVFPGGNSLAGPINGPNIQTKKYCSYGTYKAKLKAAACQPDEGVVTGFFTYWNKGIDENGNGLADNSEIDFEILGAAPSIIYMTIWTDYEEGKGFHKVTRTVNLATGQIWQTPPSKENEWRPYKEDTYGYLTQKIENFDATNNYYEYGFTWTRNYVRFFIIDESKNEEIELWKYNKPEHIPTHPAKLMFNVWHTNNWPPIDNPNAKNNPPSNDAILKVDWAEYDASILLEFTPLDLCMVLDRSGSMSESMGDKTKMQGVKEAATGVVNVLFPQDRVSIVSFSDSATTNIDLTSDFNGVRTKMNAINAGGSTSFGAGLKTALDQFKAHGNPDHNPAILFMSDGKHNKAPDPEAYVTQCKNKGIPIFTVGFASSESQVDVTKLKKMSEETGGEYLFVSKIFDLQNIFLRLQHKASGWESVAAYVGEVNEGETITAGTFYVDPAIEDLRVTLNWPGSNLDLKLFDPNSRQVDFSAANVIYSGDTKPEYVIIKDPQSGYWTAKVYGKSIGSSEEYYVLVTKYVPPTPPQPAICKVQITSNTALQDRPSIVYANGNYYVAYQSHEKGYGIYIKKFDSQWNFRKKVEVVSGSAYYDSPSLIYANNKLYVAYISNAKGASANDYDIIVKEYNPSSLSCTKGAKYLTSLQSCQDLPALLYKNGYFYLAYQSWETGNGDIYIKKFDSNWNQLKKVRVTSKSSLQDRPSLTYANGYFYVAYFSEETGYYDIFVKRLDSNLNLESWKKQITSKSSYQSYPFITFVNNQFAIVYASTETGTLGIYLKTYDSNWNFIEKTKVVDSSANERRSSHTWDGSNFWVAYVYNYGDSKDWNIFAIIPGCKD